MLRPEPVSGAIRMAFMARIWTMTLALAVFAACALDEPGSARSYVAGWTWPAEGTYFSSTRACTVAVFQLDMAALRPAARRVYDLRQGIALLRQGRAVAFADTRTTPDTVAQGVMSADLHTGLGMLASVTGARACMSDAVARGVQRLLTAQGAVTVYDPGENAVVFLDFGSRLAVFLRAGS